MKQLRILIFTLLFSNFIFAGTDCSTGEAISPEKLTLFLVQLGSNQGKISNFSDKIEKGASSGTTTFQSEKELFYFVRAEFQGESISGVVKCDSKKQRLIGLSIGWSHFKLGTSGVLGGNLE